MKIKDVIPTEIKFHGDFIKSQEESNQRKKDHNSWKYEPSVIYTQ